MDQDWFQVQFGDDFAENSRKFDPAQVLPTPPSSTGSPLDTEEGGSDTVSVSTTFYPGAQLDPRHAKPDIILVSSDAVFFYVHSTTLQVSNNAFGGILRSNRHPADSEEEPRVIHLSNDSASLNVILHSIYEISCAHYSPTFETLVTAVESLPALGLCPKTHIDPSSSLFNILLSYAPLHPLQLYALAAHFDIHDLAVSTSSHLLSYSLPNLTDEMAERIGPTYLKRLFFLHFGRSEALKRVLLTPPHPHPPTAWCDFAEQKKLTRAWALASAYLAWDARPDLSTSAMESALSPLGEHLSCEDCRVSLRDRIKTLVVQWSIVRRTI